MSKTRRAACYARFSTENQKDRSVDDQLALCREYAKRNGYTVVAEFSDRARTATTMFGRDGLLRLMEEARAGHFDFVITEALNRLSRDQEDLPHIYKRLKHLGIEIVAVDYGVADPIKIGVQSMFGAMFIADVANKVRRGMVGVVSEGRHAGGRAYGYRPVPSEPGKLQIVEDEATVIRRIYTDCNAGLNPREIAHALNREGVPPPRGAVWTASAINGNGKRGCGILRNPLYVGKLIWNRVRMIRNPDNGKRVSRINDASDWKMANVPELAIIDQDIYDQAQARMAGRRKERAEGTPFIRKTHMLSGMMRCAQCGGGMVMHDHYNGYPRVRCSRNKEAGTCTNGARVPLPRIETAVIQGLQRELSDPVVLQEYLSSYREEMRELTTNARRQRDTIERKLSEANGAIARLVNALAAGNLPDAVVTKLQELEAERGKLQRDLARAEADVPVVELHPQAVERYRQDIKLLAAALPDLSGVPDAMAAFKALVAYVVVHAGPPLEVEVLGKLAALTGKHHSGGNALPTFGAGDGSGGGS